MRACCLLLLLLCYQASGQQETMGQDEAREGRFISTFLDLVDSFMPNFQVDPPKAQSFVELQKIQKQKESNNFEGPPSHIQFIDMPVDSSYMDESRNLMADYEDEKENRFEHFSEVKAPSLQGQKSQSSIAFRPLPPNYVWTPEVKTHSEERLSSRIDDDGPLLKSSASNRPRRPHKTSLPSLLMPEETFKSSERLPDVKPYVYRKPTVNPLRKLYMDKEKKKLQKLYKSEVPYEDEDTVEKVLDVKKRLNRDRKKIRRKGGAIASDIIIGRRKSEVVAPVSDLPLSRIVHSDIRRQNNVVQKRILEMESRQGTEKEDYNDDDEEGKEPIDQKAVESEFERVSKPKRKTKEEKINSGAASSFDQMSFWRDRFESERIKSFLSTKKSKEEESTESSNKTSEKDLNIYKMRGGGLAKEIKSEANYVTNSPSMRVRGPQSKGAIQKNQTKKYSPRVMRPLAKVANIEKNAKDSLKRPMVKPHNRHLGKIEALPFMSREEKENEEIQVGKFEEWSKRTGQDVLNQQAAGIQKNWKAHGWEPLEKEKPKVFPRSPSLLTITRKVSDKFKDIQKIGSDRKNTKARGGETEVENV